MTGRLLALAVRSATGGRTRWLALVAVLAASRTHTHLRGRQ